MSVAELIKSAQVEKGQVMLDLSIWEQIVSLLEDLDDLEYIRQVKADENDNDLIPWEDVEATYLAAHPDAGL